MATILYSLAGEGRGHAARARAMIDALGGEHRFVVLTSGDAFRFLEPFYRTNENVEVRRIPGVRFQYADGRMNLPRSIGAGLVFKHRIPRFTARVREIVRRAAPALAVVDFEPLLPRVARELGVPVVSLDHQHFLVTYDLSSLPLSLRRWAWGMRLAVALYRIRPEKIIVSAFFRPPLKKGWEGAIQVGPLLRREVHQYHPTKEGYLLSYLRHTSPPAVLEGLKRVDREVRVYGLGARPSDTNLVFKPIHERTFLEDLSGCAGVVAATGNQLIGESLFFGKPFFGIPERLHHEQRINAYFLQQMGCGDWRFLEDVGREDFVGFSETLHTYAEGLGETRGRIDATQTAAEEIRRMISR